MRCPKCGYISFDHSQPCPKCSKDISAERKKMNLPSYRPAPLSLLGSLTGESDRTETGPVMGVDKDLEPLAQRINLKSKGPASVEGIIPAFGDERQLEIQIERESEEKGQEVPEVVDLSSLSQETTEIDLSLLDSDEEPLPAQEDFMFNESEMVPLQPEQPQPPSFEGIVSESPEKEEPTVSFDLDSLSLDEQDLTDEQKIPEEAKDEASPEMEPASALEERAEDQDMPAGTEEEYDEDFPLDLDSLDLDLDLEEPDE